MSTDADIEYAGFWVRVGASLIDTVWILLATVPLLVAIYGWSYFNPERTGILAGPADLLISYVVPAAAIIAFWVVRQATPGKMVVGAKVVDAQTGAALTVPQSIGRYLGYFVSTIPLGLGLIWVAFDPRKQGWHDKLAGTVVIRTKKRGPVLDGARAGPEAQERGLARDAAAVRCDRQRARNSTTGRRSRRATCGGWQAGRSDSAGSALSKRCEDIEARLHNPNAEVVYDIVAQRTARSCIRNCRFLYSSAGSATSDFAPPQGSREGLAALDDAVTALANEKQSLQTTEIAQLDCAEQPRPAKDLVAALTEGASLRLARA